MQEKHILKFIQTVRESFGGSIAVYTVGNCYQFFEILESIFPDAKAYYDGNHVWTKIDGKYYDIRGLKDLDDANLVAIDQVMAESLSKNKWTDKRRSDYIKKWKDDLRNKVE